MALQVEQFYSARPYAEPEYIVRENSGGRLPRAERPLTHAQRYIARELGRVEPRRSGSIVPLEMVTGRSRIGRNR